jgi:hypothetical protein
MATRDFPNSAVLFVNDRRKNERDADLKGSGTLDCPHCGRRVELWLSAWRKTGGRAGKFLSLSFRPKDEAPPVQRNRDHDLDDVLGPDVNPTTPPGQNDDDTDAASRNASDGLAAFAARDRDRR